MLFAVPAQEAVDSEFDSPENGMVKKVPPGLDIHSTYAAGLIYKYKEDSLPFFFLLLNSSTHEHLSLYLSELPGS